MSIKIGKRMRLDLIKFFRFILILGGLIFLIQNVFIRLPKERKEAIQIQEVREEVILTPEPEVKIEVEPETQIKSEIRDLEDLEKEEIGKEEKSNREEVIKERKVSLSRGANTRYKRYNIPLSDDLQKYAFNMCEKYDVEYELALAVMYCESGFKHTAHNKNNNSTQDYGLMQINSCNHQWLSKALGITDFYDPYDSITAGVFMLSHYNTNHGDIHKNLMNYNMGIGGSNKLNKKGIFSSRYSRKVVKVMQELKGTSTIK